MKSGRRTAAGFTLLELVVTIAIMGVIAAVVVVFLQRPVEGYFDTTRRARLVDTADFALRRIARDLATALPNSARSDGSRLFLEMLTSPGGVERTEAEYGRLLESSGFRLNRVVPTKSPFSVIEA